MSKRLISPKYVRDLLQKYGINARKKYGQNFLVDENILHKIIAAAELEECSQVLEIGPGLGTLTRALSENAERVVAIELDTGLHPLLEETLAGLNNVDLIFADALKQDLSSLFLPGLSHYIVSNLPYYITSPLLTACLNLNPSPLRMVFLVQREVGERLTAQPGSKHYGSLGVFAQGLASVELVSIVSPKVFYPVPEVESCIVTVQPLSEAESGIISRSSFELTNRAIFGQRRKTLLNSLKNSPHWKLEAEQASAALSKLGMEPGMRGEQLSVKEIIALANELSIGL
jgi:16S rRNA (adenine1518-N6/adenine1519-N6)-dimethyltransferase